MLAFACLGAVGLHVIVTSVLTIQTLIARKRSGAGYFRDNLMFWARRISGFALLIPLVLHILTFIGNNSSGAFRLNEFGNAQLILQILFVILIAFHVFTNIGPALISLGVRNKKAFAADMIFVISVILLFAAGAFCIYYLRWAAL